MMEHNSGVAQVLLPSKDLPEDMNFLTKLGFRLNEIFPADAPAVAIMSGHGLHVRLDKGANCPPPTIHILVDDPEKFGNGQIEFTAPNGTLLKVLPKTNPLITPPTVHKFQVHQLNDKSSWGIGRAGMLYRDLIPDRLGGSIIASHIRIPNGGPVGDNVHYHTIGFQLIFCINGWVKLVYEDQGPPFILQAGDCVTQPPQIRHRVLESSDNLEVIEIGVPSTHMTTLDHQMTLPTNNFNPDREFQGQKFCHHVRKDAQWKSWRVEGFECVDTKVNEATRGIASVHVARPLKENGKKVVTSHNADILFNFVLKGELELSVDGHESKCMKRGDSCVIPPDFKYQLSSFFGGFGAAGNITTRKFQNCGSLKGSVSDLCHDKEQTSDYFN